MLILQACTTVAEDPTVPAWATATTDAKTAFANARTAEQAAFIEQAVSEASARGSIYSAGCLVDETTLDQAAACRSVIKIDGAEISTATVGDKLASDVDKLAAYGSAMKLLATAQDVTDEQAAINKLGASAGSIFALVGVPGLSAVTDLASELIKQSKLGERRQALYQIAQKTQPAINALAEKLQAETTLLRANVILGDADAVSRLQTRFVNLPAGDPSRPIVAQQLLEAVQSEHDAAALKIDFSSLAAAHRKMVISLGDPKIDFKDALSEINTLDGEVEKVKTAFKPKR
jgi:hypothetical protein